MRLAWGASSYRGSSKPTEKVFTGRSLSDCMTATMRLESTPPESSAPRSTSATIRPATVSRSRLSRSEEHTSELQSLMRISYAVFCLQKKTRYLNEYSDALPTPKGRHRHKLIP